MEAIRTKEPSGLSVFLSPPQHAEITRLQRTLQLLPARLRGSRIERS